MSNALATEADGSGPKSPVTQWSVTSEVYGDFLNSIFDEWVRNDIGKIFIQLFDESVRPFLGMEHALCIYRESCGDVPTCPDA